MLDICFFVNSDCYKNVPTTVVYSQIYDERPLIEKSLVGPEDSWQLNAAQK